MNRFFIVLSLIIGISLSVNSVIAQGIGDSRRTPPPVPIPPKLSDELAKNLENLPKDFVTTREDREKSYAKLLEGQRYIWSLRRVRSRLSQQTGARLAKEALRKAIELDPNLAEAYTALAELALIVPPQDIDEAIKLSNIAVKLDKDNFGGYRFLGRLNTIKSNLGRGRVNKTYANKAINAWKEITRLDPRYAEAWAFLSAFYEDANQKDKRIDALRNWLSSSTPLEVGFYSRVMARDGDLSTKAASLKLGEALLDSGEMTEALTVLTRAVSDSPNNLEAVELLSRALENASGKSLAPAIRALRQSVYANPDNLSLNQLLAQTLAKSGNIEDATKFLKKAVIKFSKKDKKTAASFQLTLGDIYSESNQTDKAIASYKEALRIRGITTKELTTDVDKDFAYLAVNKMISAYKKANRFEDAKLIIETSRPLFGKDDLSLDREYVSLLREDGDKDAALKAVRSARVKSPFDYNLIRTEASILVDLGRVDEGVELIQNLIDKKPVNVAPSIMYDDYINYLFISRLYSQSNRNEDAIKVANKVIEISTSKDRKQIAQLNLASALQTAENYDEAERVLQNIIKESPDNHIALNNLGYLFLESGKKYNEALKLIEKAVEIDPRNPSYLDSLGWAYYKLGNYKKAEEYLIKAVRFDGTSSTIFEHLGDVYEKNGKIDKAREAWKKALNFSSNSKDSRRIKEKLSK